MSWAPPPGWKEAVEDPHREVSSRVEAIGPWGSRDIPVDDWTVAFNGEAAEQWRATFKFSDPDLVPLTPRALLDGRSGTRLRIWWRLMGPAGWMECPLGTYAVEDPMVEDNGKLSVSSTGMDLIALARRGRYQGSVVSVGGMTVSAALQKLFQSVAPSIPFSCPTTTRTLPGTYDLWDKDPAEDWRDIAQTAGWTVRTNRVGVIEAAEEPDLPPTPLATWIEGDDCPMTSLSSQVKTSSIPRSVRVVSTSPGVSPPVVGLWVNPDADSWNLNYDMEIESSAVASKEAADSVAKLTGSRWARPQQSLQVTIPPRPDLGYRDPVAIHRARAGVSGTYAVSGWDMSARGLMTVRLMTRQ